MILFLVRTKNLVKLTGSGTNLKSDHPLARFQSVEDTMGEGEPGLPLVGAENVEARVDLALDDASLDNGHPVQLVKYKLVRDTQIERL